MNIEVLISLDGENLPLNEDLQNIITKIINSYIKQKISGVKVKPAKDPNAPKREGRPHLTVEEKVDIYRRAKELQNEKLSRATDIISQEINRPFVTIRKYLGGWVKEGKLTFIKYEPSSQEMVNRFKPKEETSLRNIFQQK